MTQLPQTPSAPESSRSNAWLRPELVSSWTEFILVAAVLLVMPIRNSTSAALHGSSSHFMQMLMSNDRLLWATFVESALLALFLVYLKWRGWTPADLRIGLGWFNTAQGLGLCLLAQTAAVVVLFVMMGIVYALQHTYSTFLAFLYAMSPHIEPHSVQLSWAVILVAMIINAFLEEIICMGYIFNQLAARRGPSFALVLTVFLRVACHTYQDPIHLAGIGALFTVYGLWYWRTRRLWPLIFAHILLDVGSMAFLKVHFG